MNGTTQGVIDAALALPEAERVRLAETLLATVPTDVEATPDGTLEAELERRFEEYLRDPSTAIPWSAIRRDDAR